VNPQSLSSLPSDQVITLCAALAGLSASLGVMLGLSLGYAVILGATITIPILSITSPRVIDQQEYYKNHQWRDIIFDAISVAIVTGLIGTVSLYIIYEAIPPNDIFSIVLNTAFSMSAAIIGGFSFFYIRNQ
jgi:hypothetical protein